MTEPQIDILKKTINLLKKDPGIDQKAIKNREKTGDFRCSER